MSAPLSSKEAVPEFTPGPWELRVPSQGAWGVSALRGTVNIVMEGGPSPDDESGVFGATLNEAHANARLIAAAPDLYKAVLCALNMVDGDGIPPDWDALRRVVAKAEGRS